MTGPLAFCRLDDALVRRVRFEERLLPLLGDAVVWLFSGAAIYGATMGIWRSPLQSLFAALKMPLLLLALVVSTATANAAFAKLARTKLSSMQVLFGSLHSMAILAIVLGALSPAMLLFTFSVPQFGESLVGSTGENARIGLRHADRLLALHVILIGTAGLAALTSWRNLLAKLIPEPSPRTRMFWLSFGVQVFAGTQLSWILRPYLGKPQIPVEFLRPDAFDSSFFEEIAHWVTRY